VGSEERISTKFAIKEKLSRSEKKRFA